MDNYYEQNVAGERGFKEQLLYSLCWAGMIAMGFIAVLSMMGVIGFTEDSMRINWINLIMMAAAIALIIVIYRVKDKVYPEYDYILWNGELEICAVYNRSRRKKLTTIQLSKVTAWGPQDAMARHMHGVEVHNYSVHKDQAWCLVYADEHGKKGALLELNEETCAQLRALGSAMRMAEAKA